jgi:hypothetical protein
MSSAPNQVTGNRGPEVIETAAEAFDREVPYLAAASDMYGRRYPLLIDPTRDPLKFRQSLDASDATTRAAVDALCDEIGLS